MSTLSTKAKSTVHRLLKSYGQLVTITHNELGAYDPDTGTVASVATVQTAVAVEQSYAQSDIDGTMIHQGDKKLFLTAKNIVPPVVEDTCTVRGVVYTIKNVISLAPDGTDILFELQARK